MIGKAIAMVGLALGGVGFIIAVWVAPITAHFNRAGHVAVTAGLVLITVVVLGALVDTR